MDVKNSIEKLCIHAIGLKEGGIMQTEAGKTLGVKNEPSGSGGSNTVMENRL